MTSWLDRLLPSIGEKTQKKKEVPEGLWVRCLECGAVIYRKDLDESQHVCPKCDHHMRLTARQRLGGFLDGEGRVEIGTALKPKDILKFKDKKRYKDRLEQAKEKTGENDALLGFQGALFGQPLVAVAFDFQFMGGSMGSVVGEKFVLAAKLALDQGVPLVCFSASGGARMQEALISLMQMARTSAMIRELKEAHLPFVSILTDPVYGGVTASLAMLGDINLAEPQAYIGFAGPRVIEQTVREKLPEGFQKSEFLLEHGMVDKIVHRHQMRETVYSLLGKLCGWPALASLDISAFAEGGDERPLPLEEGNSE